MNRSDGNRLPVQVLGRDTVNVRPVTDDEVPHAAKPWWHLGLVGPISVLGLGLLLGIVNQMSREVSGGLRTPALIAALVLVAQALMLIDQPAPPPGRDVVVLPEGDQIATRDEGPPGRPVYRQTSARVVDTVRDSAVVMRDTKLVIWLGLILSVILGLATLANPTAPPLLLMLSLLAAFLVFADAWRGLRGRR